MLILRLAACAALLTLAGAAFAEPPAAEPSTADTPPGPTALPVDADWKARADAWFTATDDAGRRKEMRAVTRALRQPCRYCHTPDFTGYTDKRLISQQMMALSAEHGVECKDCHAGKATLTPLGQKAAPMWTLAREKGVFCGTCHVKHRRFEALTERGQRFRAAEWAAWQAAHPAKQSNEANRPNEANQPPATTGQPLPPTGK